MTTLWKSADYPTDFERPQVLEAYFVSDECGLTLKHLDRRENFEATVHCHHTVGDGHGDLGEKGVYDSIMHIAKQEDFSMQTSGGIFTPSDITGRERSFSGFRNTTSDGVRTSHLLVSNEVDPNRVKLGFTNYMGTKVWEIDFLRLNIGNQIRRLLDLQEALIVYNQTEHWMDRFARWKGQ